MKILSCAQIREVDKITIEHEPISSVNLMERASMQCADWIAHKFGNGKKFKIFAGPGNNGGDGLAMARLLSLLQNKVTVYLLSAIEKFSPDALTNYKRLKETPQVQIIVLDKTNFPDIEETDIIIDALFGSGLSRPLDSIAAQTVRQINNCNATVVSIDLPSGLFGEDNTNNDPENIIRTDYTLTFQAPKLSFFFAENEKYIGEPVILDIQLLPVAIQGQVTQYYFTEGHDIRKLIKKRARFSHKGTYGHALLVAGSYGKIGAALLSAHSCLRSGVGLLTCHLPGCGYTIMQSALPEAMVSVDEAEKNITTIPLSQKYSAIGIGPGIGTENQTAYAIAEIIKISEIPLVIDADALNILSLHPSLLEELHENTIITPHPGEFDRIAGPSQSGFERHLKQIAFSQKYKIITVLKGAYTSISTPNGNCYFNPTGNPGMATAGSGDVLTGIILSLLAQGYNPLDATLAGVYIHGLAGDIALENLSYEALIATDIINHLGKAFKKLT